MRFGASHSGVFETSQHHHGWSHASKILLLEHEYLCSLSFFNCAAFKILSLQNCIFTVTTLKPRTTLNKLHLIIAVNIRDFTESEKYARHSSHHHAMRGIDSFVFFLISRRMSQVEFHVALTFQNSDSTIDNYIIDVCNVSVAN